MEGGIAAEGTFGLWNFFRRWRSVALIWSLRGAMLEWDDSMWGNRRQRHDLSLEQGAELQSRPRPRPLMSSLLSLVPHEPIVQVQSHPLALALDGNGSQ